MNYLKDLEIDKFRLDVALMNQPILFATYSDEYSKQATEHELAKEELDVFYATLDKEVRLSLEESKEKYTEAVVRNRVITDPRYRKAAQKLIKLREEMMQCDNAKKAFEHRRSSLEGLVKLWCANYFAEVKIPEKQDVVHEALSKEMQNDERILSTRKKR